VPIEPQEAVIVENLYDAYGAGCYRLAHRMVADERLACTIVRDVFVSVWSGEAVFDPARGSVEAWLLRATHGRAVSVLRLRRQLGSDLVDDELPAGGLNLDAVLRHVLELAYFGGYTESEIATLTRTTPSMVKTLTREALRGMCSRPSMLETRRGLSSSR
jgi:DNA-directed RNA polymerase specialized sigma24 family protein